MPPFPPDRNDMSLRMPSTPPPNRVPQRPAQMGFGIEARAVSPGSIRHCVGNFTYIWLRNGLEFWMFPIQVWGNSVAGFRWDRRFGWSFTGISLNRIDMFTCSIR
ncbi:MAG: hypothetical protein ACRC3H_20385 [Lachnospiraceae bacterium]